MRNMVSVCFVTFMVALLSPAPTHAGPITPITVAANWDIVNNTGQLANDFHIDAYSDSNLTFVSSINGAFGSFSNGQSGFNPLVKNYDWSDGNVAAGAATHIGLELLQQTWNNINIQQAYWTKDGNKIGGFVPLPGFKVVPAGGDGPAIVTMSNESATGIYIGNASYSVGGTETPLGSMMFNPAGLGTSISDFSIPANSFFDIFTDIQLDGGDWLLWQGQIFSDSAHQDLIGSFVDQHEHDTPEPAGLLLTGAGLLAAAAFARKRGGERP